MATRLSNRSLDLYLSKSLGPLKHIYKLTIKSIKYFYYKVSCIVLFLLSTQFQPGCLREEHLNIQGNCVESGFIENLLPHIGKTYSSALHQSFLKRGKRGEKNILSWLKGLSCLSAQLLFWLGYAHCSLTRKSQCLRRPKSKLIYKNIKQILSV